MQKNELLKRVQEKMGDGALPMTKTGDVVAATFEVIADAIVAKDSVTIHGFGTFVAKEHGERAARNPQTKEPITVPAGFSPKFKPSTTLKNRVNAGE